MRKSIANFWEMLRNRDFSGYWFLLSLIVLVPPLLFYLHSGESRDILYVYLSFPPGYLMLLHAMIHRARRGISDHPPVPGENFVRFSVLFVYFLCIIALFALFYHTYSVIHETGFSQAGMTGPIGWFDAFYFSAVTATTLGYGDISPNHISPRVFCIVEVLSFVLIVLSVMQAAMQDGIKKPSDF